MLLEFKTMTEAEACRMVREVYIEALEENARWRFPELEDLREAMDQEEKGFCAFLLNRFFPKEENTYFVLEVDGAWVSALRLTKLEGFYYLEALETAPEQRKKGYASRLIREILERLKQEGPVMIRDSVKKTNEASLATHKKCGFLVEREDALNYLDGKMNPKCYGMLYEG